MTEIEKWWHRIGCMRDTGPQTGEEAAMCDEIAELRAALERAERALVRAGFQDLGGEEWKPPLGPAPKFIEIPVEQDAQDAARYRWLRAWDNMEAAHAVATNSEVELDEWIDAAMKESIP